MGPRETPKAQRRISKIMPTKAKSSPASAIKKKMPSKKPVTKTPLEANDTTVVTQRRTATIPNAGTPKPKENKTEAPPASATKSIKKPLWKRRPKPAHSGVPMPEKMKKITNKQLQDCSF